MRSYQASLELPDDIAPLFGFPVIELVLLLLLLVYHWEANFHLVALCIEKL